MTLGAVPVPAHADAAVAGVLEMKPDLALVDYEHKVDLIIALFVLSAGHPEVVGTMGEAPDRMFLIAHPEEVDKLQIPDPDKVAYLTQTTLSLDDTRACIEALRRRFPKIAGPAKDDICYATQNRQDAVKELASLGASAIKVSLHIDAGPTPTDGELAAMDDELLLVVAFCRAAEDAAVLLVGVLHVLEAPRRPQRLRHRRSLDRSSQYDGGGAAAATAPPPRSSSDDQEGESL